MVLVSSREKRTERQFVDLSDNKEEVYHRIDQRENNISYYCRVINQLATKGTFHLSYVILMVSFFRLIFLLKYFVAAVV